MPSKPPSSSSRWPLLGLAMALATLSYAAAAQLPDNSIEEQDLADQELEAAPIIDPGLDLKRLASDFTDAENVFRSALQPEAESLFSYVIDTLEPRRENGTLSDRGQRLLARSLAYRARVRFNLGDRSGADDDLGRVIGVQPTFDLARDEVSPKLAERFDELRAEVLGLLELTIEPSDAEVRISGRLLDHRSGPVGVLAGIHTFEVRRPGYTPLVQQLEVRAGRTLPLDFALDRTSPVLRVISRPSGAEVRLDGLAIGRTIAASAAELARRQNRPGGAQLGFSAELVVAGLEKGQHLLEVVKDGYRTYRADLDFDQLQDYRMPPVPLELQRGTLLLRGLPDGARVLLNGNPPPTDRASRRDRLELPPDNWHLLVIDRDRYVFERRLDLADRQSIEIDIKPRPGLVLLGVLGNDDNQAGTLRRQLERKLAASSRWTVLERSAAGLALASELGLTASALRQLADDDASNDPQIDWQAVRQAASERFPGLLYGLAVLSNDLLATHADLWLWPAAPAPPRPDRIRLPLDDQGKAIAVLAQQLGGDLQLQRAWLGALVIDSTADGHPIIAHLTAKGPAATAGLEVGDRIVAVAQAEVTSRADLDRLLSQVGSGQTAEFVVRSRQGTRVVNVEFGSSPRLFQRWSGESSIALTYAQLMLLEDRPASQASAWVVQFNQAMLQIRAGRWEEAVRMLRGLSLPAVAGGIGTATVDYWLGVALANAGPRLRTSAKQALTRAAADPNARLYHHDGPRVAPRAKLRLQSLGVAP